MRSIALDVTGDTGSDLMIKWVAYFVLMLVFMNFCHESMHIILGHSTEPEEVCILGQMSAEINNASLSAIAWVYPLSITDYGERYYEYERIPTTVGLIGLFLVSIAVMNKEVRE